MNIFAFAVLPIGFGLVGAITPCALGVNAVFLGYVTGKPRLRRLAEWPVFALSRATVLMALGLAFGLLGQAVGGFVRGYQQIIAWGLIILGALLIVSRFRPVSLPSINLLGGRSPNPKNAAALGVVFGLDIPACTSPLVLALLAQTVLVGNYLLGALALFLFGIGMSLPLLVAASAEGANQFLVKVSQRYQTAFYILAGGLLMLAGAAELSPQVMGVVGGWTRYLAEPLLSSP